MKKKIVMGMLLSLCMLTFAGCDKNASSGKTESQSETTGEADKPDDHNTVNETLDGETDDTAQSNNIAQQADLSSVGESFSWNEITVTIPDSWKEKCIVLEDEDGFSFYQKASYEKEEYMGYLCGFVKSDKIMNYGAGETLIAYTESGSFYYMMQPTDVTFDVENEETAAEYHALMEEIDAVSASVLIAEDDIRYDANQFIFPNSSVHELEDYELVNLTNNELWIARNEIYARHGRTFQNEYLQSYFNSCSWYQAVEGKSEVADSELSEIERANLEKIVSAEIAFDDAHPYPVQYQTGSTVLEPIAGNGLLQDVVYEVKEKDEYEYDCILTIEGTAYNLQDYAYMTSPVTDVFYITDLAEYDSISENDDGLEIAVLDEGPSNDPVTHFYKYDGELKYIGEVGGFPFKEENYGIDGFIYYNGVKGRMRTDLIETAYIEGYWWYDVSEWKLEYSELGMHKYLWYNAHELFIDLPVYCSMDENAQTTTLKAQKEVYFIETDLKEWILVRGKDGTSGYIRVKDGKVLNVNELAENVFSDLYFFD